MMFWVRLTVLSALGAALVVACARVSLPLFQRNPAEADYRACGVVEEELIGDADVRWDSLPKDYAHVKRHVFQNHCASCHFGADSYPPQLDNYEATLGYVNQQNPGESVLLKVVEDGTMPPSSPLASREAQAVSFLREWVISGAQR